MSDELKPCPCCGGVPERMIAGCGGHYIQCHFCKLSTCLFYPLMDDISEQLAERWNSRCAAQPAAMCGCGDTFGEGSVCANCLAGIDCKPVPDDEPAVVPEWYLRIPEDWSLTLDDATGDFHISQYSSGAGIWVYNEGDNQFLHTFLSAMIAASKRVDGAT